MNDVIIKVVAAELQARLIAEIKQLYAEATVVAYEGKTVGSDPRDYATRLLSEKLSVDEALCRAGPALFQRVYYTANAPVIAELISCADTHGRPSHLQAGVWMDKMAFNIEYFAWIEVYIPQRKP